MKFLFSFIYNFPWAVEVNLLLDDNLNNFFVVSLDTNLNRVLLIGSAFCSVCLHFIWCPQLQPCSSWNLEFPPSISSNVYQPWYLPSPSQDSLFPAGLTVRLTPSFLRLRFRLLLTVVHIFKLYLLTYLNWLLAASCLLHNFVSYLMGWLIDWYRWKLCVTAWRPSYLCHCCLMSHLVDWLIDTGESCAWRHGDHHTCATAVSCNTSTPGAARLWHAARVHRRSQESRQVRLLWSTAT